MGAILVRPTRTVKYYGAGCDTHHRSRLSALRDLTYCGHRLIDVIDVDDPELTPAEVPEKLRGGRWELGRITADSRPATEDRV